MRSRYASRAALVLLGLALVGGLLGCQEKRMAIKDWIAPDPGQGDATAIEDDSLGIFKVIPLSVTGCDEPGDMGGTVNKVFPSVFMWSDQRVAWVILGRDSDQRWEIRPKANQSAYFNNGSPMKVETAGLDAYFTGNPATGGDCYSAPYCVWKYDVIVKTLQGNTWQMCAELDPKIRIRD